MPYVRCAYLPPACLRHKAACPGTALLYVHSKRASLRRAVGTAHHRAPPRTTYRAPGTNDLFAQINGGGFKLKKASEPATGAQAPKPAAGGGGGMAAMLADAMAARRGATGDSDDDDDDDDDWD